MADYREFDFFTEDRRGGWPLVTWHYHLPVYVLCEHAYLTLFQNQIPVEGASDLDNFTRPNGDRRLRELCQAVWNNTMFEVSYATCLSHPPSLTRSQKAILDHLKMAHALAASFGPCVARTSCVQGPCVLCLCSHFVLSLRPLTACSSFS
jgi:hypothetical protein